VDDFVIGLDLDGVCYHFDRTARYMLRRRIKERGDLVPERLNMVAEYWDWYRPVIREDDWEWLWDGAIKEGLYRYGHIVGGAIEGVQALNKLGDVVVITSRPKAAVHDTLVWLTTMFDKAPLAGLHILSQHQLKSSVRPLPNVFIDDADHNIQDIVKNTPKTVGVVIFDQPWNRGALHGTRIRRAYGWAETVTLVEARKDGKW
jgi:hypothetical protein